jgi:iron(III) transport system permease protein
VPGLLRVRVYTTEVFTAFAALYDFSRAIVLAVPLLALSAGAGAVAAALLGHRVVSARRLTGSHPVLFERWGRLARLAVAVAIVVAVVLPIAVLTREALNVRSLRASLAGSGEAIANSLILSALGATIVTAVAVSLGYARARARDRVANLADILFVVLFAVPSTIVGVGLIQLWNRPGVLGSVYGTDAMFILAFLARFVPVAALMLAAAVRYVPISHEESAAAAGARWLRTMWRIVLPQLRLPLAAAWIVVFVLSFGELGASVLIAPPGESTLPIRIYTIIANAPPAQVAALALLQAVVVFSPLAVLATVVTLRPSARKATVVEGREDR